MKPEYINFLSLFVSVAAVIIAAASFFQARRLAHKQLELQAKQQELAGAQLQLARAEASQRQKAVVVLSLEGYGTTCRFYLRNRGPATARKVSFTVRPPEGKQSPLTSDYKDIIPVPEMPPGHEVSVLAALNFGTGSRFDCEWSWENSDGSSEKRQGTLTSS